MDNLEMILISHRGNTEGKKPGLENGQRYCEEAIEKGFDVEIDVHWYEGIFWTGHDRPQYRVRTDFLKRKKFGVTLKNILDIKNDVERGYSMFLASRR